MTQRERQWQPVRLGSDVPAPAGAYSPMARAGGLLFVSGQVPRDPLSGQMVGDDIESQTAQVMTNVKRALEAGGAALTDIVSVTVYLANDDDWARFNAAYKELMPTPYPTRTTVGADLRGFLIEMTVVAYLGA